MLERAARCLKSAPSQTASQFKHAAHSRRMLHSAFWRHGAGDLDLPAWCFHKMRALFEPEHAPQPGDTEKQHGQHITVVDRPFLDFLYPEKTHAMIKRLSIYGLRRWHRRMRSFTNHTGLRYFISTPHRDATSERDSEQDRQNRDRGGLVGEAPSSTNKRQPGEALQNLLMLLKVHEKGEYRESWNEAWECYSSLDNASKTGELSCRVISLLGTSPRALDTRRLVRVFTMLPVAERSRDSITKAILAHLKLKEFGKAVLVHTQATHFGRFDAPIEGTKILIAHLIAQRQWQLVFHTYDSCARVFGDDAEAFQQWSSGFFGSVLPLPGLTGKILFLLSAIVEHPYLLTPDSNSTRFVTGLIDKIVDHGIDFGVRRDWQLVDMLTKLDICPPETYEKIALLVLNSRTGIASSRKENALRIYKLYSQTASFSPSKPLLHTLIKAAVDTRDLQTVLELLPHWYKHHGLLPTTLTGLVMKGFARAGDIAKVNELLERFISGYKQTSWKVFYPVLHVQALHGDPEAVQAHMSDIAEEHGLQPDITCYNILLYAFQRSEDLDGTLATLSKLLQAGLEPDHYTIGTIMAVGADRGDVELCEQMLRMAYDNGIRRSRVMNDCAVLAYLNNFQTIQAETLARTLTIQSREYTSTRMWNQILTHHAVDVRPDNLKNTLRVARLMQKFKIPYNSMTYAAIMRAYTVKRRTDAARRILRKVVMNKGLPVLPIHYAIIMDGYANQLNIEKGLRMQAEMLRRGIKPTISTKLALQKLHTAAAQRKILIDRASHPGIRLDILDENLEEMLQTHEPNAVADRDQQLQSSRFRPAEIYPAAYFDLPLNFYANMRAFDVVKTLIEKYQATSTNSEPPLRFLATFMNLSYRENAHNEVDRYWGLALDAATRAAKVAATYRGDTRLPPVRRRLLASHFDTLLRSLDARGGPDRAERMLAAIDDLFARGFDLDSTNWNLYVQLLVTRGDTLTAFRLCERNLMATFPGWREYEPRVKFFQATRQKAQGTEFLGPRYTYLKPGELRASYKTMVRFAWALRRLRRAAPFEKEMAALLEELQKEAPRTVKAVLEMPMLEHPTATHVLGTKAARGERRKLPA